MIDCVGFLLVQENKMLIEKRSLTKRTDPGKKCIPSGGINAEESAEDATVREVEEEFGIKISKQDLTFVGTLLYPGEEVDFLVKYFFINKWAGDIKTLEADKLIWTDISEKEVDIWTDKLIVKAVKVRLK